MYNLYIFGSGQINTVKRDEFDQNYACWIYYIERIITGYIRDAKSFNSDLGNSRIIIKFARNFMQKSIKISLERCRIEREHLKSLDINPLCTQCMVYTLHRLDRNSGSEFSTIKLKRNIDDRR